ncbi:AT-hook motif nuclear-localized protein 20-like [Camellia sinensis]|uniref:AT-hook motif nuclear-localized protein 20-like n=1 Tax=Camellia sinensis TaxID=4442 RepID=UPI0010357DC8|nr:AT-hook motif nuclear-localized protein 20-like [Camellia sinensis]
MAEGANQRPRGRPPSFKNKPKLAVIQTTRDGDGSMKATVLEIAASGTFLGSSVPSSSSSANSSSSGGSFSSGITLADQQGHVFGGVVSGKVMAATKVITPAHMEE